MPAITDSVQFVKGIGPKKVKLFEKLHALGKKPADGTDEYDMVELLHEVSSMEIPQSLAALKTKPRRFDGSIDKSEMQQFVLQELHLS